MSDLFSIIISAAASLGIFYGVFYAPNKYGALRSFLKTLPVTLLAIGALISFYGENASLYLPIALVFCALGDGFLSRDGDKFFITGLTAFLLAHIFYIFLFLENPGAIEYSRVTIIGIASFAALLALLAIINLWRHLAGMKVPVILYAVVISIMIISAWITGQQPVVLVGVAVFALSDMVLAHELFYWQNETIKKIAAQFVWYTYLLAQILITTAFI